MVSNINPNVPTQGVPASKSDLRTNLGHAKTEIEALQAAFANAITSPLQANLDVGGFAIVSTNDGDIQIIANGTGQIVLDNTRWPTGGGDLGDVLTSGGDGTCSFAPPAGGGGGEANTGANVGVNGVGVFEGKAGVQLQFRNIHSLTPALSATLNGANNDIELAIANAVASGAAGLMTGDDKEKLDSVAAGAQPPQTGSQIVSAINVQLGQTDWQSGASGSPSGGGAVDSVFGVTGDVDIIDDFPALSLDTAPSQTYVLVVEDGSPPLYGRINTVNFLAKATGIVSDGGPSTFAWFNQSYNRRIIRLEGSNIIFRLDDVTDGSWSWVVNRTGTDVIISELGGITLVNSDDVFPADGLGVALKIDDALAMFRVIPPFQLPGVLQEVVQTGTHTINHNTLGILQRYTGTGHTWTIDGTDNLNGIVPIQNDGTGPITIAEGSATVTGVSTIPPGSSGAVLYSNSGDDARVVSDTIT